MGIRLPRLSPPDPRERALWRTPVGLGLIAAFLLPVAVLATVSTISVQQRKEIRELLTRETYASIADLAATKLSEGMESWEREMLVELEGEDWEQTALIARAQRTERAFPLLRPFVLIAPDGEVVYPLRAHRDSQPLDLLPPDSVTGTNFDWLLADAEEIELRKGDLETADRMFVRAAGAAKTTGQKVRALTGLARVRYKRGYPGKAAALYEEITTLADPLDPTLARFAVMARLRRGEALEAAERESEACAARLDTLQFLQRHRFNLAPDLYAFYRAESERQLLGHQLSGDELEQFRYAIDTESELDDIDSSLELLLRQLPQLAAVNASDWLGAQPVVGAGDPPPPAAETEERLAAGWQIRYLNLQQDPLGSTVVSRHDDNGWLVARRWRTHSVKKVMYWVMELEGPWQEVGLALLGPTGEPVYHSTETMPGQTVASRIALTALPGWQVVTYPLDGSLDQVARQDVVDYAVLLGAAFLAVVGAMVLATRTVSRQVALARARSDFVSNVSHELKTPLALIRMFAENLRADWVPEPKKQEYYRVMLGEAERLSGVIDNVLDFSRIESGAREYDFRLTDLNELAAEIIDRYRYSFETAGIELEAAIPETPVTARVDRESLGQVLVNLLSNAAKYIGDGRRRVTLTLRDRPEGVEIEVADTGVGMAVADIERIFKPFCRLHQDGLRSVAGSGIGLTIVQHIVHAHGGRVKVKSERGAGSVFTVCLPHDPEATLDRRPEADPQSDATPRTESSGALEGELGDPSPESPASRQ